MSGGPTLCFIGPFNPDEPRNSVILRGLRENFVETVVIPSRSFRARTALGLEPNPRSHKWNYHAKFWFSLLPRAALENAFLLRALIRHRADIRRCAALVLLSYSNYCVPTAKIAALLLRVPLILEAHNSLYYQRIVGVHDYSETSRYARAIFLFDRWTAVVSDVYVTNCGVYARRLAQDFRLPLQKFVPVYLGSLEPEPESAADSRSPNAPGVVMVSSFKVYHGCEQLLRAVACLERRGCMPPRVVLVGNGSTFQRCVDLAQELGLRSVEFPGFLSAAEVSPLLRSAKIVCGTLGGSALNEMDIPTKLCDAAAFGKAFITRDTPAAREVFVHGDSIFLCRPDDPEELASAITTLLTDDALRARLEQGIRVVYDRSLNPAAIGRQFLQGVGSVL